MRGQYPPATPLPLTPPPKYHGRPEVTLAAHLRDFDDPHHVKASIPVTYSGSGEPTVSGTDPYKAGDWYVDILTGTLYVCRVDSYSGELYWFAVTRSSLSGVKVDGVPLVPDDDGYVELSTGLSVSEFLVTGGSKVFQLVDGRMNRFSYDRMTTSGDRIVVPGAVAGKCRHFYLSYVASAQMAVGSTLEVVDDGETVFSAEVGDTERVVEAIETKYGWVFRAFRPITDESLVMRYDASLSELRGVVMGVVRALGGHVIM